MMLRQKNFSKCIHNLFGMKTGHRYLEIDRTALAMPSYESGSDTEADLYPDPSCETGECCVRCYHYFSISISILNQSSSCSAISYVVSRQKQIINTLERNPTMRIASLVREANKQPHVCVLLT